MKPPLPTALASAFALAIAAVGTNRLTADSTLLSTLYRNPGDDEEPGVGVVAEGGDVAGEAGKEAGADMDVVSGGGGSYCDDLGRVRHWL